MSVIRYSHKGSDLVHVARRDAGRDTERFLAWLDKEGSTLLNVVDTHDYESSRGVPEGVGPCAVCGLGAKAWAHS